MLVNTPDSSARLVAHHAGRCAFVRRAVVVDLVRLGVDVLEVLALVGTVLVLEHCVVHDITEAARPRVARRDNFKTGASGPGHLGSGAAAATMGVREFDELAWAQKETHDS